MEISWNSSSFLKERTSSIYPNVGATSTASTQVGDNQLKYVSMHDGDYGTCNFKCRLQFLVSDSFQFVEYLLIVPIECSNSDQDLDFNICLFIFS